MKAASAAKPASARPERSRALSRALVRWYEQSHRRLPWRTQPTPYRVWVAEVLLQQTRVDQAIPFYERFLRRFPRLEDLAGSGEQAVLKVWEGAGYYARARNLHRAAQIVRDRYDGVLPSSPEALATLPGIGPYIANAIAAIAYQRPVFPMEANGARVGARLTAEERPLTTRPVRVALESWWSRQMAGVPPGTFAQAVMELGETVCLPRRPLCPICPVSRYCQARRTLADPALIPTARPRPTRPHVRGAVVAVSARGRILVHRRPSRQLLGGLWELPGGKIEAGESPRHAAVREFAEETGLHPPSLTFRGVVRHAYSHFSVELHLFAGAYSRSRAVPAGHGEFRWLTPTEFRRYPRPRATIRLLELWGDRNPRLVSPDSRSRRGRGPASPRARRAAPRADARGRVRLA